MDRSSNKPSAFFCDFVLVVIFTLFNFYIYYILYFFEWRNYVIASVLLTIVSESVTGMTRCVMGMIHPALWLRLHDLRPLETGHTILRIKTYRQRLLAVRLMTNGHFEEDSGATEEFTTVWL